MELTAIEWEKIIDAIGRQLVALVVASAGLIASIAALVGVRKTSMAFEAFKKGYEEGVEAQKEAEKTGEGAPAPDQQKEG